MRVECEMLRVSGTDNRELVMNSNNPKCSALTQTNEKYSGRKVKLSPVT